MSFSELVKEAFIDPLRSVLIVDDQYPTWEEILNDHFDESEQDSSLKKQSEAKSWRKNPADPMGVIQQFRRREPGLVIDIHDGVTPDHLVEASHLHQSDLLVIDYNLEGEPLGGDKARKILQSVLKNQHFNLVVVHTGEDSLDDVMFECLLAMMTSCTGQFDSDFMATLDTLGEKLDEIGDGDDEVDREQLLELFTPEMYLELRRRDTNLKDLLRQFMRSEGLLKDIGEWARSAGLQGKDFKDLFSWVVREFEKPKLDFFAVEFSEGLSWKNDTDDKWMRTSKGFVTFVKKGSNDLISELQSAIECWKPTPSRLISAKYRHELNKAGVVAEDRTLQKKHVFAHFYKDFYSDRTDLEPSENDRLRNIKLKAYVARQSEEVAFHIEDEVARFGEEIRRVDKNATGEFASHYNVDLADGNSEASREAIRQYNSFVSTLPLKEPNDQLDSGHVFKLGSDWWVCATPACDLQPGQTTIGFNGSSSTLRPFTALKLLLIKNHSDLTSLHINSGLYCFVEDGPGNVVCLGLQEVKTFESQKQKKEPTIDNGKVLWRMYLALESGLIVDGVLKLSIPKLEGDEPIFETKNAEVVSKLRYEYALNYIQKVGTSVSRIGLGYLS